MATFGACIAASPFGLLRDLQDLWLMVNEAIKAFGVEVDPVGNRGEG